MVTHIYDYRDVQQALKSQLTTNATLLKALLKLAIINTGEQNMLADIRYWENDAKINIMQLPILTYGMQKC